MIGGIAPRFLRKERSTIVPRLHTPEAVPRAIMRFHYRSAIPKKGAFYYRSAITYAGGRAPGYQEVPLSLRDS